MESAREPRVARAVAAAGLVASLVALAFRRIGDWDLPWNLATGRFIAEHRTVPRVDPFSFTHQPLHYVEVAGDLLLHAAHSIAGPVGLQVLGALAAAVVVALVARGPGRGGPWSWAMAAGTFAAMLTWLTPRPALLSFALLAGELALLEVHRRAPGTRRGRLALASLAPLLLLWANVHGYVTLGASLALAYLGWRLFARLAGGRLGALAPAEDGRDLAATALATALGLAAACASTMGPALLLGPFRGTEDFTGIAEWEPTTWALLVDHEPAALVLFVFAAFGFALGRDRRTGARVPSGWELALALGGALAAARLVRLVPVGALLVGWAASSRDLGALVRRPLLSFAFAAVTFAPAELLLVGPAQLGLGWERDHYPDRAVAWIAEHEPRGRMWNFWPFGGWLTLRLWPGEETFLDGRNALARDRDLVTRGVHSIFEPDAFHALDAELGFGWAITSTRDPGVGAPLAAPGSGFRMVHRDAIAAVYVREVGPNAALARGGYRVLTHLTPIEQVLRAALSGGESSADLAHDGALAASQDPTSAEAAALEACGALAVRDEAGFERALGRLAELAPGHPGLDVLRAGWTRAAAQR